MKRLLPLFEAGWFSGSDLSGHRECRGLSISVQWLGFIVDVNFGRVAGRKGKAS